MCKKRFAPVYHCIHVLATFSQELELELLRATNRMAAMATDHAQQMESLTDQINNLKVGNDTGVLCLTCVSITKHFRLYCVRETSNCTRRNQSYRSRPGS